MSVHKANSEYVGTYVHRDPQLRAELDRLTAANRELLDEARQLREELARATAAIERVRELVLLERGTWIPNGSKLMRVTADGSGYTKTITVVALDDLMTALDGES